MTWKSKSGVTYVRYFEKIYPICVLCSCPGPSLQLKKLARPKPPFGAQKCESYLSVSNNLRVI